MKYDVTKIDVCMCFIINEVSCMHCCCSFLEGAIIFYKDDRVLCVKTALCQSGFSQQGRKERAEGGVISTVHAPIRPMVELRNIVPQVNKRLSGK